MTFYEACVLATIASVIVAAVCGLVSIELSGRLPERDREANIWTICAFFDIGVAWIASGLMVFIDK